MSAPEQPKAPELNLPELTVTDHYIGILKLALEYNATIVNIGTQVLAMDSSGHNRKTLRWAQEEMKKITTRYTANLDDANRKLMLQFLPKEAAKEAKDNDGSES